MKQVRPGPPSRCLRDFSTVSILGAISSRRHREHRHAHRPAFPPNSPRRARSAGAGRDRAAGPGRRTDGDRRRAGARSLALQPWIDWVLREPADWRCPVDYADPKQRRCVWPTALSLNLDLRGGEFGQQYDEQHQGQWIQDGNGHGVRSPRPTAAPTTRPAGSGGLRFANPPYELGA